MRAETAWRKSSYSNGSGECVEVAATPSGDRLVRDTKHHGTGPVLWFSPGEWAAFVGGVRHGEFGHTP